MKATTRLKALAEWGGDKRRRLARKGRERLGGGGGGGAFDAKHLKSNAASLSPDHKCKNVPL
jgi:hypothetical protein